MVRRAFRSIASLGLVALAKGDERVPPKEFRVFSRGINHTSKGDFVFDEISAQLVMEAYAKHGADIEIDYDHAATATPQVQNIAAGWAKPEVRDGELWLVMINAPDGEPWTPKARAHFAAGEYRYFSPLFRFDEATCRVTELINCALTNTPAMDGIDALVAASRMETDMNDAEIKRLQDENTELRARVAAAEGANATSTVALALGLGAGAKAPEIAARAQERERTVSSLLEVTGEKTPAAALGAVAGWKAASAEVATIKAEREREVVAGFKTAICTAIDTATAAGKIAPADKAEWEADAIKIGGGRPSAEGVAWLNAKIAKLAPLVRTEGKDHRAAAVPHMDADAAAMSKILGIDHGKYAASLAARAAR